MKTVTMFAVFRLDLGVKLEALFATEEHAKLWVECDEEPKRYSIARRRIILSPSDQISSAPAESPPKNSPGAGAPGQEQKEAL